MHASLVYERFFFDEPVSQYSGAYPVNKRMALAQRWFAIDPAYQTLANITCDIIIVNPLTITCSRYAKFSHVGSPFQALI